MPPLRQQVRRVQTFERHPELIVSVKRQLPAQLVQRKRRQREPVSKKHGGNGCHRKMLVQAAARFRDQRRLHVRETMETADRLLQRQEKAVRRSSEAARHKAEGDQHRRRKIALPKDSHERANVRRRTAPILLPGIVILLRRNGVHRRHIQHRAREAVAMKVAAVVGKVHRLRVDEGVKHFVCLFRQR